jgi:hypothetical protein
MHRVLRSAVVACAESLRISFARGASGVLPSLILMAIELVRQNMSRLPWRRTLQ